MKKVLIIGVDSLIGKTLYLNLKKIFKVYGTSRREQNDFLKLNLLSSMKKFPSITNIDTIIFCAGITNIVNCQRKKNLSNKININGLKKVLKKYKNKKNQIIYFSSTCVFDGKKPFQKIKDIRKPLNHYGYQKKVCEDLILNNKGLIIRAAKLVETSSSLIKKWKKDLKQGKNIFPYTGVNTSLISLKNIVEIIKYSIDKKKSGILHLSAPDEISYLDIAKILTIKLKIKINKIIPITVPKKLKKNFSKFCSLDVTDQVKKITKLKNSNKVLKEYLLKKRGN